jgi:PAS domain S-box-containing protein
MMDGFPSNQPPSFANPGNRPWNSASWRWIIAGALFAILFFSIGTAVYCCFQYQRAVVREAVERELSAIADLKVQQIVEWRNERMAGANRIKHDPFIGPFVRAEGLTATALCMIAIALAAVGLGYLRRWRDTRSLRSQLAIERESRRMLDSLDEGVLGLDSEGRHVFANPAACRLLGYEPEELIGKCCHDVWHYRKADGAPCPSQECLINVALKSGEVCRSDQEVFWRKDGTSFPVEYIATPSLETNRPVALALTFRDVSQQRRLEEERTLTVQRMESLLGLNQMSDQPPDRCIAKVIEDAIRLTGSEIGYVAVLNDDESVLTMQYWSKSAHASCEITDKPMVYPVEKTGLWGEAVRQRKPVITNDYSAPNPHKRGTPQGHVSIVRHLNIPVFSGQRIVAVAGVGNKRKEYDESDVRQLQLLMEGWWQIVIRTRADEELRGYALAMETANRALQESNRIAESATRAKSEFLANMSHEIRTPMTAILGFTDILMEDLKDEVTIETAQTIKRNGEHLLRLINDILDISKVEAGKMKVELSEWSPRQIIADVVSQMRVRAHAKGLTLRDEYEGMLPQTIITDPFRLRQILINIVGNAVKFTDAGSVRIVTKLKRDPPGEPMLTLDVIDTGIGIRDSEVDKLFKPFTQVDGSASRRHEGTGLGLVISRQLAQALGGDVTVRSEFGKGSTFTIHVSTGLLEGVPPVGAQARLGDSDTRKEESPGKLPYRILLADDMPDNQRLIAAILRGAGAEVTIVGNGQEAVASALAPRPERDGRTDDLKEPFHVVLMDMQMPLLDGYEATRNLRREGYTRPIIALTAHSMRGDREKCIDAGCDDYLAKPVNRTELFAMVAKWASPRGDQANEVVEMRLGTENATTAEQG